MSEQDKVVKTIKIDRQLYTRTLLYLTNKYGNPARKFSLLVEEALERLLEESETS